MCTEALCEQLTKKENLSQSAALTAAVAKIAGVNGDALAFVLQKSDASFKEGIAAIREGGGEDGTDTLTAIEMIQVQRIERLKASMELGDKSDGDSTSKNKKPPPPDGFKVKDKVAVLSSGEWWEATVTKVMPRRSGTMYQVRFSDRSVQTVDSDSVREKE